MDPTPENSVFAPSGARALPLSLAKLNRFTRWYGKEILCVIMRCIKGTPTVSLSFSRYSYFSA